MKAGMLVRLGFAVAGVLMAGAALAQGPGGGMGAGQGFGMHRAPFDRALGPQGARGRFWNNPELAERLKLTDDQRKSMDAILLQHREKLVDLRASLEKAELKLEPLMQDDQPNEAKVLASIDEVAQARAELEKANARFLLAIRGKLTPEQWKQVQAFRAERGQERHGMGPDGRGHGQRQGGQFRRQAPPPTAPPQGTGPQGMMDEGAGPGELGVGAEQ
jgi:protein CpxP